MRHHVPTSNDPRLPVGMAEWNTVELDLRDTPFPTLSETIRRAATQLEPVQQLRVRVGIVSWPAMAALSTSGFAYRFTAAQDDRGAEFMVWPRQPAVVTAGSHPGSRCANGT